jgi:glycosyltransferase involved in cell wall biosynthesis
MHLVVVLPALNESKTIAAVIAAIPRVIDGIDRVTVAVIDDGSTDNTAQLARDAGAIVHSHVGNRGLGVAFASGVDLALSLGADIMVNMDSDGQFNPAHIPQLLAPILEGKAEFVTCSRFGNPEFEPKMPWIKRRGNAWMTMLVNLIARPRNRFTDVSCGFRAYTRETLLKMNLFGTFTYTQETFLDLAVKAIPMAEVPLPVRGVRQFGKSRVARNLWNYALQTSTILLRSMRDYRPLLFFGSIGVPVILLGVAQIAWVSIHWLLTGLTSPYTSMIVTGSTTFLAGFILFIMALLADMQGRGRLIQERLLYFAKKEHYARLNEKGDTAS